MGRHDLRTGLFGKLILLLGLNVLLLGAQTPTWEDLEARKAILAEIEVLIGDVFDPAQKPAWLARAGNWIHMETRPHVVRRELRFAAGNAVNARKIRESERALRALSFLREARIDPELLPDGRVRARVLTADAWTLFGTVQFSSSGGDQTYGAMIHEGNLLGLGKDMTVEHKTTPERRILTVDYRDPQFLGGPWILGARVQDLSDGSVRSLGFYRPFRSLDAPWDFDSMASREKTTVNLYNQEKAAWQFQSRRNQARLGAHWKLWQAGSSVQRLGLGAELEETDYAGLTGYHGSLLPQPQLADRRLGTALLEWRFLQDRYQTGKDLARMSYTEDYNLGWQLGLSAGLSQERAGKGGAGSALRLQASKGWKPSETILMLLQANALGRRQGELWRDLSWNGQIRVYHQGLSRQTWAFSMETAGFSGASQDRILYLGADQGLRAYPNYFQAGDRRWKLQLEDRILTDTTFWGLLRLGFVAFLDVGAVRRLDTGSWSRSYSGAGAGLRLGDLKTSFGSAIYLVVSVPLVKEAGLPQYQIHIGNVLNF